MRRAFEVATRCLEKQRDAINALNVFPVPDGDTGTNMLLTMRSVNEECLQVADSSAGGVMAAMAHGALLGARGNSGVILSQFFHGLHQGLRDKTGFDGEDLAKAFALASNAAYSSVSKPVDGTMLTVIRELSLAASHYLEGQGGSRDPLAVWQVALEAAKGALSRTPQQLPVLREAGVVDAGGQGVVTLLEGAWCYLAGENVDDLQLELVVPSYSDTGRSGVSSTGSPYQSAGRIIGEPSVQEGYLAATEDELYGYCTQLLIHGQELDVDPIRERLSVLAESVVVVGSEGLVRVHVHTHDPGPLISYAVSLGTIGQVSVDNIDQQHREFVAYHRGQPTASSAPSDGVPSGGTPHTVEGEVSIEVGTAVVVVAWGEGFARLFEGLGCANVLSGGQTMNPSTQELLNAASSAGAREVILLPNNPNIIPAAQQAASIAEKGLTQLSVDTGGSGQGMRLRVIPSRTLPQGVAALLAFNPEESLDTNLEAMGKALATVKTLEVTKAVRPVTLGGIAVDQGRYIGLLEGELVAAGDSSLSVFRETLMKVGPTSGQLVTLYWGGDIQESQAIEAAEDLRQSIPGVDVEVVYGGQPFYQYVGSVE